MVNDDGPPDTLLCPYLRPFIEALGAVGHDISVVIPNRSRSWIGKAHLIGESLTATYCAFDQTGRDWVIVDGTPASCVQLGIYNLFQDRPPIDLVVSGPNHGRNASTIYNLSSGTVGGALEAANCGRKAVALSFASKKEQPASIINAASRHAAKLITQLASNWPNGVELLNINIPMHESVESSAVVYTKSVPSYWTKGSLFAEVEPTLFDTEEHTGNPAGDGTQCRERRFAWIPDLSDIEATAADSPEGTDMWATRRGCTSVTPLRANYAHEDSIQGEILLPSACCVEQ